MKSVKLFFSLIWIGICGHFVWIHPGQRILSALACFLLSVSASAIHLSAHELGHLVGGLATGYRLVDLKIGLLRLSVDASGKYKASAERTGEAYCTMMLPKERPIRFLAYNLGGGIANILVCILSLPMLLNGSDYTRLFSEILLICGAIKIMVNLIPSARRSIPNDGYTAMLLRRRPELKQVYAAYLALYAAYFRDEAVDPEDYNVPTPDSSPEAELIYHRGIRELLEEMQSTCL